MTPLQLYLVDRNARLVAAWQEAFAGMENVFPSKGDILKRKAKAIISPANSFGYMDGGIDLHYSEFFGWDLEDRLQKKLEKEYFGELPVGMAVIVETNHREIPYLISAPTMRVPMDVSHTTHAYLAFRAALLAVKKHNRDSKGDSKNPIDSILCPGLCTGEGRMAFSRCAVQMAHAYTAVEYGEGTIWGGLAEAVRGHMRLMEMEF